MATRTTSQHTVAVLASLGFANVCAANIFFPLLPGLQDSLRLQAIQLGAWMSVPALVALVLGPLAGRAADTYGYRLVVVLGLVAFALGAAIPFLIPYVGADHPYYWILVGRVLQNLGHVVTFPLYLAMAGQALAPSEQQPAMGTIESWTSVGGIVGALIGSFLLPIGLYVPFAAMAGILLIALAVVVFSPHLPRRRLAQAQRRVTSSYAIGLLADGWHGYLGGFLLMGFMVGMQTFVGSFARDELGASRLTQGLLTALIPAFMALGSMGVSLARDRAGQQGRVVALSVLSVIFGLLLWIATRSVVGASVGLACIGAGLGVWLPIVDHDISETSTEANRGTRLSLLHVTKSLGIFLAPGLVGSLIDQLASYRLAFTWLLVAGGVLSAVSLLGRWRAARVPVV